MAIYRGVGGSGESTTNTIVNLVAQYTFDAEAAKIAAQAAQAASEAAKVIAEDASASALADSITAGNAADEASESAAEAAASAAAAATFDPDNFATAAQGDNADTAFGWGDHADAGYAAASNVYAKTEADSLLDDKADQATTYTKTEVDASLATKQAVDTELTTLSGMAANRATFLASEQAFSFRNRIINAQGLINQRAYVSGTATTTANQYTVDRWRVVVSGQNLTFTTTNNEVTFTAPAGGIEQVIEGLNLESGTYVLNWEGTATATVGGAAVAKGGTVTVVGGTNTTVRFIGGTYKNPQLEAGSVATPFERRPYGTELALCQRYFESVRGSFRATGFTGFIGAHCSFKATKRVFPTMVLVSNGSVASIGAFAQFLGTDTEGAGAQWNNGGENYAFNFIATASAEL
jgi:hypothetical protein